MKRIILIGLILVFVVGCGSKKTDSNNEKESTNQAGDQADSAAKDNQLRFEADLSAYLKYTSNQVEQYCGTEGQQLRLLCSNKQETGNGVFYYLEGEYNQQGEKQTIEQKQTTAEGRFDRAEFITEAYYVTNQAISQLYGDVFAGLANGKITTSFQTEWLKSPVQANQSWQTHYLDTKHGMVEAEVELVSIEPEQVTVCLRVVDQSVPAADRKELNRTFAINQVPKEFDFVSQRNHESMVLKWERQYAYQPTTDWELLDRFGHGKQIEELTKENYYQALYPVDPLYLATRVAEIKRQFRIGQEKEKIDQFEQFGRDLTNCPAYGNHILKQAFEYGLQYSQRPAELSRIFYQTMNNQLFVPEQGYNTTYFEGQSLRLSYYNGQLLENQWIDISQIQSDQQNNLILPNYGDFRAAKYVEQSCLENGLPFRLVEEIYYDIVEVKNRFYQTIKTDNPNVSKYIQLAGLGEKLDWDLFDLYQDEIMNGEVVACMPVAIERYQSALTKAQEIYQELESDFTKVADVAMVELFIETMRNDYFYWQKYGDFTNFGGKEINLLKDTPTSTNETLVTGFAEQNLIQYITKQAQASAKPAYFQPYFAELNSILKANNYCYSRSQEAFFGRILGQKIEYDNGYYLEQFLKDLEDYRMVSKALDRSANGDTQQANVGTVKQLIDAIKPGAKIVLEPKAFLISETDSYATPYADLAEGKLTIQGVDNLTVTTADGFAAILSDGQFDVLVLENCQNIKLEKIRIGHLTEPNTCIGDVLQINNSNQVTVIDSMLFGSGVVGLRTYNIKQLSLKQSVISGCSMSGMVAEASEQITISNCIFRDNQVTALHFLGTTGALVENCRTIDNAKKVEPDIPTIAIMSADSDSEVTVANCTITEKIKKYSDNIDVR